MDKILLIDGDILLYRVCSSLSSSFDFGDTVMHSVDMESMQDRVKEDLEGILKTTGCKKYIICLSGSDNFRKKHFPSYKTNRKSEKPQGYDDLKKWTLENFTCKINAKLEGDDIMGMYCTKVPGKYVIFSIDKDMKTIPTTLWDFKGGEFYEQSDLEALTFLYTQVLTGDVTDGYKGCPGIGKVGAARILEGAKDELDLLLKTITAYFEYYGYGYTAISNFLEQIGQARILHYNDWLLLNTSNSTYNPLHLLHKEEVWELQKEKGNMVKSQRKLCQRKKQREKIAKK